MRYSGWELNFFDNSKNFRNYQFFLIKKYLKNNLLEVGPGNGIMVDKYISKYFSNISLSEIDKNLNKTLVKKFKNKKNVKIYRKKIGEFKNKFNSIIYSDVIEHIKDDEKEIKIALKKLNKNGYLIIMVPAFQYLYSEYDKSIGHFRRYEKKFFVNFAKKNKIKFKILNFKNRKKDENKSLFYLKKNKVDLICLAGFMKILSKNFIMKFKGKILNIHPSLLPKYKGLNTHQRAIENNEKFSGCTVHFVNSKLDSGKIILRKRVRINKNETPKSLSKKILRQEHVIYPKAILKVLTSL